MTDNDVLVAEALADIMDKFSGAALGMTLVICVTWVVVISMKLSHDS